MKKYEYTMWKICGKMKKYLHAPPLLENLTQGKSEIRISPLPPLEIGSLKDFEKF